MNVDLVSKFVFPAPPASYKVDSWPGELLWIPLELPPIYSTESSVNYSFPCLLLACGTARYFLVYFHRNAEDVGSCRHFCEILRDALYVHVLIVEYPGYGPASAHHRSIPQAMRHGMAAYKFVRDVLHWPTDSILLCGCSIGTCIAMNIAAAEAVAGTTLVAPFLSLRDICRHHIGAVSYLVPECIPNADHAAKISSPTLIVHGKKDMVVPAEQGKFLYDMLHCKKAFVSPEHLAHNTFLMTDVKWLLRPMIEFFSLPDYNFEEIAVPMWAFHSGPLPDGREQHLWGVTAPCASCVGPGAWLLRPYIPAIATRAAKALNYEFTEVVLKDPKNSPPVRQRKEFANSKNSLPDRGNSLDEIQECGDGDEGTRIPLPRSRQMCNSGLETCPASAQKAVVAC
mmetsp:Transcript_124312/g.226164  ORF Transcript_124312/g.226164 Transcript_124312/m.226164 type:complete len:398 (-) Transcript_124312:31-1224(-)